MERSIQIEKQNKSSQNHIYAVCSGAKAVGKTWLTATVCHNLGLLKKKVLFFDADCGIENISRQLDIKQCIAYNRLFNGSQTLNNSVFHFETGKFDVVCSFPGEDRFDDAPLGRAQLLAGDLAYFSKSYDYVFIDCADETGKTINPFFNICRNIIVLADADPSSVTAALSPLFAETPPPMVI